jgi:hypothetical protein
MCRAVYQPAGGFATTLADLRGCLDALAKEIAKHADIAAEKKQALGDAVTELREAAALYEVDLLLSLLMNGEISV